MKIIICTLRRSGSTVFWKAFRDNTNFTCYDEPFNPGLAILPKEHKKQVYAEYIELIKKDPKQFWNTYSPINPVEENKPQLSSEQKAYFKYLLDSDEHVVIDTTRCWNKLASLKEVLEPYPHLFIHLHRDPIAFTSSHLLPSEISSWRLRRKLQKEFWTKKDDYNYWKMEEVMGKLNNSAFEELVLKNYADDAVNFYDQPAYIKLLIFWKIANEAIKKNALQLFGSNYVSVQFEEFLNNPARIAKQISEMGEFNFNLNQIKLKTANPGFDIKNSKWNKIGINYEI